MTALPLLRITTTHSEYVIDQNKSTFTRQPVHEYATDMPALGLEDGAEIEYSEITSPLKVGQRIYFSLRSGQFVLSTPVTSIEEAPVELSAGCESLSPNFALKGEARSHLERELTSLEGVICLLDDMDAFHAEPFNGYRQMKEHAQSSWRALGYAIASLD